MEQLLDTIFQRCFQITTTIIAILIGHLVKRMRKKRLDWIRLMMSRQQNRIITLFDCRLRRTFSIRNRRNSILALESASICCASANSFLSRPWWPLVIDCIIFSAPFFTFVSILSCFSNDTSSLSFGVKSGVKGDWGVSACVRKKKKMENGKRNREKMFKIIVNYNLRMRYTNR